MKRWIANLRWLYKYLLFFRRAQTANDLHQPLVYAFARAVLEDKRVFYAFLQIRAFRRRLLQQDNLLAVNDLGAGSKVNTADRKSVGTLIRYSALSEKEGILLFRMVQFFKPQSVLELGTSLGISALYLKLGSKKTPLTTVEGSPEIARKALQHLNHMSAGEVEVKDTSFDMALKELSEQKKQFDFFYIDGDHRGEAMLTYIENCKKLATRRYVIVLADIYWSDDMERAWNKICHEADVPLSIDLFYFGLLVFDPRIRIKQHYCLVRRAAKPWRTGIGLFT